MRRLVALGVVSLVLPFALAGESFWSARRAGAIAACAASFWDAATTASAVRHGAREANPFLAGPDGRPRWGRVIGLKLGLCGGTLAAQELVRPPATVRTAFTALNWGLAAAYSTVALRNRQVERALRSPRGDSTPRPGTY